MNFSRTREMIRKRHRHNIENESQSALEVFKTNHTREEEEVFGTLICCPSCDYQFPSQQYQAGIQSWRGLPAGVKFDPTDEQILEHLEAKKKKSDSNKLLHPVIDQFIPTLQGDDGICYTHPRNLPGVSKDGQIRHFFHRPSKAYTTGKRKRRKVQTDEEDGNETRWHKTGKTRPILCGGVVKGFKKILVLYTNYGRQKKPEKTNWVMHQYHLGINEDEKDGEFVASKVFFQKQPRQCGSSQNMINDSGGKAFNDIGTQNYGCDVSNTAADIMNYYNPTYISYSQRRETSFHKLGDEVGEVGGTSFIRTDTVTRK